MNYFNTMPTSHQSYFQLMLRKVVLLGIIVLWVSMPLIVKADIQISLEKTPNDGIQPQVIMDAEDTLHLIYFKGDAGNGDLFYVQRQQNKAVFSEPLRVNSQKGSAIAIGTVRGGQMAIGKNGRIHVVWNGSSRTNGPGSNPLLYTRLNDDKTEFESQRNLIHNTKYLDGGSTVAADCMGNIYVTWHSQKIGNSGGEESRQIWIAQSTDDGKSFSNEVPAWETPTGSCSCCSMRSFTDRKGSTYILYRAAKDGNRGIYLLNSNKNNSMNFNGLLLHNWEISTCPMSTMSLAEGPDFIVSAWETAGQIYFAKIKPGSTEFSTPQNAPGNGKTRKHPAIAINNKGVMLLAWTENTGWKKGGNLAWQLYNQNGMPTEQNGKLASGIPVWGLPSVVATAEGFIIFH